MVWPPDMDSLVSVIIPTFNRADALCRAVASVLSQTYRPIEILVIDDGSTDHSGERLRLEFPEATVIKYHWQANRGVSAARNAGIRLSEGEFVAFLDSDDAWKPWKLAAQVAVLRGLPEAGMVWTDMEAIGPDGSVVAERYLRRMYHAWNLDHTDNLFARRLSLRDLSKDLAQTAGRGEILVGTIYPQMILGNLVHTSTVVLRRDRLLRVGGFDERLRHSGEDYDFHLRTCREGPVALLDLVSTRYQIGKADQLTRPEMGIHQARNYLNTIAPLIERDRKSGVVPRGLARRALAHAHRWLGYELMNRGSHLPAAIHFARSLRQRPGQARTAALMALSLIPPPLLRGIRALRRRTSAATVGEAAR